MKSPDPREPAFDPPIPASPRSRASASPVLQFLTRPVIPFILAVAVALSCYFASGVSLGLFFGPMLLMTFLASPLAMGEDARVERFIICGILALGVWLVWLVTANLSLFDAARCGLVLFSYILALAGAASLFESMHLGRIFARRRAVLIGIVWLTWPIWLCPWLKGGSPSQALVNWLTPAHPLMAMNTILFSRFNFWDRYTLAYQQLTTLNQDILYVLPRTIAWAVAWHIVIGAGGLSVGEFLKRRRVPRSSVVPIRPGDSDVR